MKLTAFIRTSIACSLITCMLEEDVGMFHTHVSQQGLLINAYHFIACK